MNDHTNSRGDLRLHRGLAEQGKMHAVAGDHAMALLHYRHAMRLAVSNGAPEVFFRHYLECVIESLEQTEAFDEVLEYCHRARQLYAEHPPQNEISRRDLAHIFQRQGIVQFRCGEKQAACDSLRTAVEIVAPDRQKLPLAQQLLAWIERGFHIDSTALARLQKQHRYYAVRQELIDPSIAVSLPPEVIQNVGL